MSSPDVAFIERGLAAAGRSGVAVHGFDELASTNAWLAARMVAGETGPALCVTDSQVRGSGRRGRGWVSLPGDVTFSLRRPFGLAPARLAPLGLVTGIAVAEALRGFTDLDVLLKWPNDLLLASSKLGGLLVESRAGAAVGGIGINLLAGGPADAAGRAAAGIACLGEHGVAPAERDALVVAVAAAVLGCWERFDEEGWAVFGERWRALDALEDRAVRVYEGAPPAIAPAAGTTADTPFTDGTARGVDGGGALRVERADGSLFTVHAGEVSVRPRA